MIGRSGKVCFEELVFSKIFIKIYLIIIEIYKKIDFIVGNKKTCGSNLFLVFIHSSLKAINKKNLN